MPTVYLLVLCVVSAVLLNFGTDYQETRLKTALNERLAHETSEKIKQEAASNPYPPYPELVYQVKNDSTVYYQNRRMIHYKLATMSPCNPRVHTCG